MKLTRNEYINLRGNRKRESRYHAEFDFPPGAAKRLPLLISLKKSRVIVEGLTELRDRPVGDDSLSRTTREALSLLPLPSLRMLIEWGMIPERTALPGRRLVDHTEEYRRHLMRTRTTDEKSATAYKTYLDGLFAAHDWYGWPDVDTDALKDRYRNMPACAPEGKSKHPPMAYNAYMLSLFLAFNDWMVDHTRSSDKHGPALRSLLWEKAAISPPARGGPEPSSAKAPMT